jgi:hypothetical protein
MGEAEFRPVNRSLGAQPRLGPLPALLVLPCVLAFLVAYIGKQMLGYSWLTMALVAWWQIGTWWVLTGDRPWVFLAKFIPVPNLGRAYLKSKRVTSSQES